MGRPTEERIGVGRLVEMLQVEPVTRERGDTGIDRVGDVDAVRTPGRATERHEPDSSPDLTVAVIEEKGAKGTIVDVILGVTIVKDVVVIVLFTLTLTLVTPLLDPTQAFSAHALVDLAREVGGALVVGAAGGPTIITAIAQAK